MITSEDINNRFSYHAPGSKSEIDKFTTIRDWGRNFANCINNFCPDSREKSLAITKLEEAVMWANAAIMRRETPYSS
jgi:hypothetical protein